MQEEAIKLANVIVASSLIIAGLAGLIILFVVVYRQKILKKELELKQNEALHQRNLLNATIAAQEMEQARIAKDLHDDLGALLSTLKLRVLHFEKQDDPDADVVSKHNGEIKRMLNEGIKSVRRIVNDLLPPVLKDFGLKDGIEELVDNFKKASTAQIHSTLNWEGARLAPEMELPIYRITQELLTNTFKHAEAENIWLHLMLDDDSVILEYRDDGIGFEPKTQKRNLGFRNFESRTQALAGGFEFTTSPNNGFRAFFQFPINTTTHE